MTEGTERSIQLEEVSRVYFPGTPDAIPALDRVDLALEEGRFHVLWGPSGSGKTTLLSLVGGLDRPSSGRILHRGEDLNAWSEPVLARYRRETVGILFQQPNLLPEVPLWANVSLALVAQGQGYRTRREAATHWLERVGLGGKMDRCPHQLSGGEAQRAALARALIQDPEILLADEPTSQLDAENALAVLQILQERVGEGSTVIVASHDPQVHERGERVHHLRKGRLVVEFADASRPLNPFPGEHVPGEPIPSDPDRS